jgi:O-antigen ligase
MLFTQKIHRVIYLVGLAGLFCAIPFSILVVLSIAIITITINWALEGNWQFKLHQIKASKSLWAFLLVYASMLLGVLYSSNFSMSLREMRLWLPLVAIPLVVSTSLPLKRKELYFLLLLYAIAVISTTFISFSLFIRDYSHLGQNVRYLSPFTLHIRLALMVNVAIFSLLYLANDDGFAKKIFTKTILFTLAGWLFVYLFILQSLTGIFIVVIISGVLIIRWAVKSDKKLLRIGLFASLLLFALGAGVYLFYSVDKYFTRHYVDFKSLPKVTANGNEYTQDTLKQYENGYLVGINVCDQELKRGWEQLSRIPFDGLDKENQSLRLTLIRYLSSKGLTKDSVGLSKLDSVDVRLIENSVASVVYRDHKAGIYPRLYQVLWEIDLYRNLGFVQGSSVVQRYVYFTNSWNIIKKHFFFGVGTGDRRDALTQYFKTSSVKLSEEYWLNSHNQYLTVWLNSGIFGLVLFLFGLLYPYFKSPVGNFIRLSFILIIFTSMFSIDLFEGHLSLTFIALFYSIFFFAGNSQSLENGQQVKQ